MVTLSKPVIDRGAEPDCVVGRATEFGVLISALEGAMRGRAHRILVRGAAGAGKTALLGALENRARAGGAVVLRGSGSRDEADVPYRAVTTLFGCESSRGRGTTIPASHWLYQRVTDLTRSGPLVIVLDDVQWCDERSLLWLGFLVRRGRELPLLVLLAQRTPGGLAPWALPIPGATMRQDRNIELGPLSDDDVRELAGGWWDTTPDLTFVRACRSSCGGNLSLLRQLFARLRDEGFSPDAKSALVAAERGAELFAAGLPAMLASQPEHVRRVAEAIAILGRTDCELVGMLSGVSERLVTAAIEVLRDEQIIGPGAELGQLRSVVTRDMPSPVLNQRRELAARLLNDAGRPAEEISTHLVLLPELPEPWMGEVLREGARSAEQNSDVATAARYLGRAMAAAPGDIAARLDFARVIGRSDPPAAHAILADSLERTDDVRARARIAVQLSEVALILRKAPEAVAILRGVLDELDAVLGERPVAADREADRELSTLVGSALLTVGWSDRSTVPVAYAQARTTPVPDGHTLTEHEMLATRSVISMLGGCSRDVAVAAARRAFSGEEPLSSWAFGAAAYVLSLAGEIDDAIRAMDGIVTEAARRGAIWTRIMSLAIRSYMLGGARHITIALSDARTAVELAENQAWGKKYVTLPRTALATALFRQGDIDEATAVLDRVQTSGLEGSVLEYPHFQMAKSSLSWLAGDHEGALSQLAGCGAMLADAGIKNPMFVPWWLDAARLLTRIERRGQAYELVEHGEQLAACWGSASGTGLALTARGVVTEGNRGIESLTAAVETLTGTSARWHLVRAEFLLGDALLRRDDRPGARRHFRRAAEGSVRCGFGLLTRLARSRLVAAGGRVHQVTGSATDTDVLTSGERRVAELAAAGATNREIADNLFIALRTVESHLTSAYRKLDVTGRAGLRSALHTCESGLWIGRDEAEVRQPREPPDDGG